MSLLFDEIDKLNRNMDIKQLNAICAYLHLIDSFYDQAIDEVISKHEPNQREQHEKLRNEKSAIQKIHFLAETELESRDKSYKWGAIRRRDN